MIQIEILKWCSYCIEQGLRLLEDFWIKYS